MHRALDPVEVRVIVPGDGGKDADYRKGFSPPQSQQCRDSFLDPFERLLHSAAQPLRPGIPAVERDLHDRHALFDDRLRVVAQQQPIRRQRRHHAMPPRQPENLADLPIQQRFAAQQIDYGAVGAAFAEHALDDFERQIPSVLQAPIAGIDDRAHRAGEITAVREEQTDPPGIG